MISKDGRVLFAVAGWELELLAGEALVVMRLDFLGRDPVQGLSAARGRSYALSLDQAAVLGQRLLDVATDPAADALHPPPGPRV